MKWVKIMFVTAREKAILELIIKKSGKHTTLSIATFLHVSVRTIHRDLKDVERTLETFDLRLQKSHDNGLAIDGKDENIFRLIQELVKVTPTDLSIEERKLLILMTFMDQTEPIKLAPLAKELNVSVTTLGSYLDELAKWLDNLGIQLLRKRGIGVQMVASESAKRKALANFFLHYFNEELIESLFLLSTNDFQTNQPVLFYFNPLYLIEVDTIVNDKLDAKHLKLADSDYISFLVRVCISMQRVEKGWHLPTTDDEALKWLKESGEFQLLEEMSRIFFRKFSISLNESEIGFLAMILRGSKLHGTESTYYDKVITGRSVKQVIQHLSLQVNVDLTSDFSLFQGLLAHMEPSVFRIRQNLETFNPLTEEIKKKYPVLFMAVSASLEKEFKDIRFPDDEVAYIVLHFGSALELRKEEVRIKALVVCPTGIGTSKMLASRIKKEVAAISSIDITSIKELQKEKLDNYDIIVSTIRLPLSNLNYVYVNPLLSEADIEHIHAFLRENIHDFTLKSNESFNGSLQTLANQKVSLESYMQEIDEVQDSIRMILRNLSVYGAEKRTSYKTFIKEMVQYCSDKGLVSDIGKVTEQLFYREKQGGLGIPGTSMALFHCRHDAVREMTFHIAHIEQPYALKGMNGLEMEARNILLILAPEKLNHWQLEIISIISTIIVEDTETMMTFSSSNESMIRRKLEETFYIFLQNKFAKE